MNNNPSSPNTQVQIWSPFKFVWLKVVKPVGAWFKTRLYNWLDRRNYRTVLVWAFVRMLPVHFVSLLTGYFILNHTAQGNELFLVLSDCRPVGQFVYLLVSLLFWALTLWYGARILLYLLDIQSYVESIATDESSGGGIIPSKKNVEDTAYCLMLWTPRLLGFLPFLIVFIGFASNCGSFWNLFGVFTDALIFIVFILLRRPLSQGTGFEFPVSAADAGSCRSAMNKRGYFLKPSDFSTLVSTSSSQDLPDKRLNRNVRWWTRVLLWAYGIMATVYIALLCGAPRLSVQIGPAAVAVSSFALFVAWASVLAYWREKARFPVFGLLLVLMIVFSLSNNNHVIEKLDYDDVGPRLDLHKHFGEWLKYKREKGFYSADSTQPWQPVYFLAMEGGGIRGVDFGGNMMRLLDTIPNFSERTFSVTGASGGMVGAVFYQAWKYGLDHAGAENPDFNREQFRNFVSDDYLSYVLSAYLFPEFVQRVLPTPLSWADRGKWFEQSVKENFGAHFPEKKMGSAVMSMPFLNMWREDRYRYPAYFINGAVVETGQRATYSNVMLDDSIFLNTLDIRELIGGDVSVATASTFCCRFPFILPSATVKSPNGKKKANIVDGGYVENTGIELSLEIINALQPEFDRAQLFPVLIFIKNSSLDIVEQSEYALPDESQYSDLMIDVLAPPKALINQWNGLTIRSIKSAEARQKRDPDFQFMIFNLDHNTNVQLPLGWMMSPQATEEIHRQIDHISHGNRERHGVEEQNHNNYLKLLQLDAAGKKPDRLKTPASN